MAYVLNNGQPVRCSIISDQPLFYMDFSGDEDFIDDGGDLFDFTAIEDGISTLHDKLAALEDFGSRFSDDNGQVARLDAFAAQARQKAQEGKAETFLSSQRLEDILRASRLAAALLDFAAEHGTTLLADAEIGTALYSRADGHIHINPHLDAADQILLAARELRRVWQHRQGALVNPLTFHPDQAILVNRAQIADAATVMVRIAWELQLAGEAGPWARLEGSSFHDLARAFARESYLDFRTLNNGVAQSAVFECWFLSERCRSEDRTLIQMMLADYQGYVFDSAAPSLSVTADLIAALGAMPFGKNYLAPHVGTITADPIFTEVRDRSNANFLWFIKFERSFREAEQDLQTGEDNHDHDSRYDLSHKNNKRFGDYETETQFISPARGETDAPSPETGAADSSGNNVIPFRTGGGDARTGRAGEQR